MELRTFLAPNDQQSDTPDEREPSEDWRDWNSVLRLRRDMHWTHIHDVIATGVIKAVIGECQSTQNYQNYSGERDWLHNSELLQRDISRVATERLSTSEHL
jgi:hypothetical protein